MRKLLLIAGLSTLTGCASIMGASMPGGVAMGKSNYDGAVEVYMNPGWANIGMGETLKIGARKSSKMSSDEAILIVRNDVIKNFSPTHPNFLAKIDGKEVKLTPLGSNTECKLSSQSDVAHCYQEYSVKLSFLEEMVNAKDVKFKVYLRDAYSEGGLAHSGMTTAKDGLKNFLDKVKSTPEFGQTPARSLSGK